MKANDLVGVAFIDTQIYIHQALSLKSLILVADIYKSISLLRFQDEVRTLSLVGRVSPSMAFVIDLLKNCIKKYSGMTLIMAVILYPCNPAVMI